jgi:hypothetical protein
MIFHFSPLNISCECGKTVFLPSGYGAVFSIILMKLYMHSHTIRTHNMNSDKKEGTKTRLFITFLSSFYSLQCFFSYLYCFTVHFNSLNVTHQLMH